MKRVTCEEQALVVGKDRSKWYSALSSYPMGNRRECFYVCGYYTKTDIRLKANYLAISR